MTVLRSRRVTQRADRFRSYLVTSLISTTLWLTCLALAGVIGDWPQHQVVDVRLDQPTPGRLGPPAPAHTKEPQP